MDTKNYKEYLKDVTTLIFDVDGVLTDSSVLVTSDGEMLRKMSTRDGYALKTAVDAGLLICIISGGKNEGVRKRLEGLGVKEIYLGAHDKVVQLNNLFETHQLNSENVIYMGDDIPDIPPMKLVGLPTCPLDAVPEVKAVSKYVSHKKGGQGAVRDILEQVLKVQGHWMKAFDAQYD
ncbi:HAD-IIIA family hydrolase [Flavobacteriaceae bacterium]|nr:HAD-IIIA family hydrolase [Flavobacteriaceae bacterium]MDB4206662.1 HAD-IIIA family hydrolase [Flavobacteriaceae bacterium]